MTQTLRQALSVCQQETREAVERLPAAICDRLEELRFRLGQPVYCISGGKTLTLDSRRVTPEDLEDMLGRATGQAMYAVTETLRQGFVTLPGGHRLGFCGTGIYQKGELTGLREPSSLNLRIARSIPGIADGIMGQLWTHPGSTLILGPPGRGKTTLLRDVIRQLSERYQWRVCVVDERMELAGSVEGRPGFPLGAHTDVLTAVKKSTAIVMLLRAMNPQWIAVDEITQEQDVEAMERASYCGVYFLATAHASSRRELDSRPVYRRLLQAEVFSNLITILPDRKLLWERLDQHA